MLPNESQLDEEGVAIVRLVVAARCGNSKSTAVRFFNWIFLSMRRTAETTPFLLYPSYSVGHSSLESPSSQQAVITLATTTDLTINILRRPYR